jgi:hypothetical protein
MSDDMQRSPRPPFRASRAPRSRSHRWIWLLAGVAALLVIARASGGPDLVEVGVTDELRGRWTTSDSRYAGRFLEIESDAVTFGQGDEGEERRALVSVLRNDDAPGLFILRYSVDDAMATVADLRVNLQQGTLRIESQPEVVWIR